jgi:hypothetical protein
MLSTALFCQKGTVFLGLGPTAGFPVSNNNFSYYYKNGFGGSLQSGFGVSKLGSITIYASYISIGAKHPSVTKSSLTLTKIGYRTNFSDSRFFVSSDAGIAQYGSGSRRFVISGTAGYSFKISNKTYIDLFPSYNQIIGTLSNSRWLTANILYRFNLRKK